MATVQLDSVNKVYDNGFHAIHDLSLDIRDSEFLVLVGPSGCGKSTALRMVAGLETITGGELRIGDRMVNDVEPKDRDIAMVFQNYALYPHMSVYDNIGFALKLAKVPKEEIDQRVRKAAEILELTANLERKPGQLSGGQRQRVAMGRAIVRQPAAFLMDEPLSNLDAKLRVQTRAEIARLHQRLGTTTVYVTHDQVEAMTMGERIAVMSEARLQQVGSPQDLYDNPDNRFVAGFIGSPSMNFLEVDVTRDGSEARLKGDGIDIPLPDRYRPGFSKFSGSKLVVGVRPEHLDVETPDPSGKLSGNADVVEYLGNEELIHLQVGGSDIVALIGSEHRVRPGDDLTLKVGLEKVHLFDPETTLSLEKVYNAADVRTGGAARKNKAAQEEATPASV